MSKSTSRNLKLVVFESSITAGLLSMSIMTSFFKSIGLTQSEIALSQSIFTIVIAILNLPTGWLADRLSRKWANVIGDLGAALIFLLYAKAQNFTGVVACETALGIFMSLSQGVDLSLLKHFSEKSFNKKASDEIRFGKKRFAKKNTEEESIQVKTNFQTWAAKLAFWQNVGTLVIVLLGGPIGAISFRLAIALSGATYLIGGIASLFVHDDSIRLKPVHKNPLKDMVRIAKTSFVRPRLRRRIFSFAVGREITHGIIWVFTPMLLAVGVPTSVISFAWAFNMLASIIGSKIAMRYAAKLKPWQTLAIPIMLVCVGLGVISIQLNIITVSFYLLCGVAQGWSGSTLMPLIQQETPPEEQTSVISLAKVTSQILYVPVVYLIGLAADLDLRYAAATTIIIFLPMALCLIKQLKRE